METLRAVDFLKKKEELDKLSRRLGEELSPPIHPWVVGGEHRVSILLPRDQRDELCSELQYESFSSNLQSIDIITPNAQELRWLFIQIQEIFSDLDDASRSTLPGRLANAVLLYQSQCKGKENQHDLLLAVVNESYAVLSEIKNRSLEYDPSKSRNEATDDLFSLMSDISREAHRKGLTSEILDSILQE